MLLITRHCAISQVLFSLGIYYSIYVLFKRARAVDTYFSIHVVVSTACAISLVPMNNLCSGMLFFWFRGLVQISYCSNTREKLIWKVRQYFSSKVATVLKCNFCLKNWGGGVILGPLALNM